MGTSDRREYLTATVLDQDFLDRQQDSLENKIEMVVKIQTPTGYIYASDRNKYVASVFYEALTEFPVVSRTLGEWLSPTLEFSALEISVSNVDGRFNEYLPAGGSFGGWIGKTVTVEVGLRDLAASFDPVYQGVITEIGGFGRDREKITLFSRDKFDSVNTNIPTTAFTKSVFTDLEDSYVGLTVPIVYGDWTTRVEEGAASVPAFPVNGANADVNGDTGHTVSVRCVISDNDNTFFDTAKVYLKRGEEFYLFDSADISVVGAGNRIFDVKQSGNGGVTLIEGANYEFGTGDLFYVQVKGKDLSGVGYDDNIVAQAEDILITYGGLVAGDFSSDWTTYKDKNTPAESAIYSFKSRVWLQEPQSLMEYVLQMLEQVRLEIFVNREQKFAINSMQNEDWPIPSNIDFSVKNWDVEAGSFSPKLDERNSWNRALADYSFDPLKNENRFQTPIYKNTDAITQAGKEISKKVVFPNLYEENTVIEQLKAMLRIASGYNEIISVTLSSRAVLLDLGDFVLVDVKIGSSIFETVPAMIREIGYDPDGLKIPVKLWSFQMLPYPGYSPLYSGIVGGDGSTIVQE